MGKSWKKGRGHREERPPPWEKEHRQGQHVKYVYVGTVQGGTLRTIQKTDKSSQSGKGGAHAAIVALYKTSEDGTVHFLAMIVEQISPRQGFRFCLPAETQEMDEEQPLMTANACVETEMAATEGQLRYTINPTPVLVESVPADSASFKKEVRTEKLGPPEWFEAGELFNNLCQRGKPFHRRALFHALGRVAGLHREVYEHYQQELESIWPQALVANGAAH
jgi:hypothetical protein